MICPKCSKPFEEENGYGWCEYRENCPHKYCSEDCADVTAIEEYTPACPGVYWCAVCRDEFLEAAKGHKFLISYPNDTPDVKLYTGFDPDKVFVEKCINCGIWSYEFKSSTDAHSQYENQPCGSRIHPKDEDDEEREARDAMRTKHFENSKKTIYILFGEMGCGKSYWGSRYAENQGLKFFEGDSVVPPRMLERVSKFKPITKDMLDEYMDVLSEAIVDQVQDCDGLVVAQALYLNEYRQELKIFLESFGYKVEMWWVKVPLWRNIENLLTRENGIKWVFYWLINKPFFQTPKHDYQVVRNVYR